MALRLLGAPFINFMYYESDRENKMSINAKLLQCRHSVLWEKLHNYALTEKQKYPE